MRQVRFSVALAAVAVGGLLLGSCGGSSSTSDTTTTTTTPSSTMGTDSAATKAGGMADTSRMASPGGAMMADSGKMK